MAMRVGVKNTKRKCIVCGGKIIINRYDMRESSKITCGDYRESSDEYKECCCSKCGLKYDYDVLFGG